MTDPRAIRGVGVSPGLAYAPAVLLEWNFPAVPDRWVTPEEVETEVKRLEEAVAAVVHSLNRLRERSPPTFAAHRVPHPPKKN